MKKQVIWVILLVLISLFLISGCAPKGEGPLLLEEEIEEEIEEKVEKTEIRIKGSGTEMLITPSKGREIKDIVTLSMVQVPEGTKSVMFSISDTDLKVGEEDKLKYVGFDRDGSDGFSIEFDTFAYEDGSYLLHSHTFDTDSPTEGVKEISAVRVTVKINNSEI